MAPGHPDPNPAAGSVPAESSKVFAPRRIDSSSLRIYFSKSSSFRGCKVGERNPAFQILVQFYGERIEQLRLPERHKIMYNGNAENEFQLIG